jgi:PAS domain S-box-containing protein
MTKFNSSEQCPAPPDSPGGAPIAVGASSSAGNRDRDQSILIVAPTGRDAEMTARFLGESGLECEAWPSLDSLCQKMQDGVGLIFLTGEALTPSALGCLVQSLAEQPTWSDVPLIVLTSGGSASPANDDALSNLGQVGNVTLIERPVRPATLLSTVKSALRARNRQYDVRDHLAREARIQEALRRSEEALRESEARLRFTLEAAQLGQWDLDLSTHSARRSLRHDQIFGHQSLLPEWSYEIFLSYVHPNDREFVDQEFQRSISTLQNWHFECRILPADGGQRWIEAQGSIYRNLEGQPVQLLGIVRDITQRKMAEEEREQLLAREQAAREHAEVASHLKDEFLATVSHELRTPLMAILGWTNMLRSGKLDEELAASALETIERNARSQSQLINDLLDVSRIITGKLHLEMRELDLTEIIAAAIDAVRPAAQAKDISLRLALDPDAGIVSGDSDRLQQVIWNLLTNAVKFTPNGGDVLVRLSRIGSQAEIAVVDSGKGIDGDFLPIVFDRFRQADQSSTRRYGGLGLGLSIVRQLVELHGGSVSARSEGENRGSTFLVRLPLAPREDTQKADVPVAIGALSAAPSLSHLRALVVDDETDTRELLRAVLESSGSQVRTASSAPEALELFEQWRPDVLLSDIGMPGENGYSLIRKIRAAEAKNAAQAVPAIALTAYAREDDREQALEAGFQKHVTKPVEPAALLSVIDDLCRRPEA